jgi:atypical dual specificity phosphatase
VKNEQPRKDDDVQDRRLPEFSKKTQQKYFLAAASPTPSLMRSKRSESSVHSKPETETFPPQLRLNWRQRLRQQQAAENRHLHEMVRRNSGRTASVEERPILTTLNVQDLNKQNLCWIPVHHEAIKQCALDQEESDKENNTLDNMSEAKSELKTKYDLGHPNIPTLTTKQRQASTEALSQYLQIDPGESRPVPGYPEPMNAAERAKHRVDCDEVHPGIILGNGTALKNKDYLKKIGISHILNAAEFRGVNVGREFFSKPGDEFRYLGLRVEDTPQTQLCKHFVEVACFIDSALKENPKNRVFVNCVFGKSRYA